MPLRASLTVRGIGASIMPASLSKKAKGCWKSGERIGHSHTATSTKELRFEAREEVFDKEINAESLKNSRYVTIDCR